MNNLHGLYKDLSKSRLISCLTLTPFTIVNSFTSSWPKIIYLEKKENKINNEQILFLSNEIQKGGMPRTIILNENVLSDGIINNFSECNCKPISRWENMIYDKNYSHTQLLIKDWQIRLVRDKQELNEWVTIVESVLFDNQKIDSEILAYGIKRGFISLFLGYYQNQPIATSMIYYGCEAGIYMVATLPMFRNRGFARSLMDRMHVAAVKRGYERVVLQSTKEGLALYKSCGYQSIGKMCLFYFI